MKNVITIRGVLVVLFLLLSFMFNTNLYAQRLNKDEAELLNKHFGDIKEDFDFNGKQVFFFRGGSVWNKEEFFKDLINRNAANNSMSNQFILLNEKQKEKSGGYDVFIYLWSKTKITPEKVERDIERIVNSSPAAGSDNRFNITTDTIYLELKGDMTHSLKFGDKFYALFEQRVLEYGGYGKRWLCIFADGQLEQVIDCPKEMNTVYLDFYVKHDSIILKPYMDKQSYYFDPETFQWTEIIKTDDLIFEDEKFLVYSLDFGEWGGKTWFKDKRTGKEYVLNATTPLVNKIDSTYYLTNSFRILKIENPLLLSRCPVEITYENIGSTHEYDSWFDASAGVIIEYRDTSTVDYIDFSHYKPHIVTSFVFNEELLHIYTTDTVIFIARHEKHKIVPIQKIAGDIDFFEWHNNYRCSNLNGCNELLKFRTKDDKVSGLMEVIQDDVRMHYIINTAI